MRCFKPAKHPFIFLIFILLFCGILSPSFAQQRIKKVVFQGFWWDYWNNNFPFSWSNYLCEMAPRLKAMGIDAVWIPPTIKNSSRSSVGYGPFDHYDLGDKYQKGGSPLATGTRIGTKDELLRAIAVLHANGIDVIQDLILNHTTDAGNNAGLGGQDPNPTYSMLSASGYKNFRYVSYATPLLDETVNDYWSRNGRWPKNYEDFNPSPGSNCSGGDLCTSYFGPDMTYEINDYGQSSNIPTSGNVTIGTVTRPYINPAQSTYYMLNNARNWIGWYKKQSGVDGWRWDAIKHFPISVQSDLITTTKYSLGSPANGGDSMFCVGEWVGTSFDLDSYVTNVASGGEEHTGTFDFSLRGYGVGGGLYSMVLGLGSFDMQLSPISQQSKRYFDYTGGRRIYRTVPFVNNHDTYRPKLDVNGNFLKPLGDASGWNTGNELGGNGQHIDPREPRLFAAYAVAFAVDGNPCIFFEDLFDIGTTGKRWTHQPTNETDLPIRGDIRNLALAHQKLQFKMGNYTVPTSLGGAQAPFYQVGTSGNHVVMERTGRAIIGITDKYSAVADNSQDEQVWISVGDPSWNNLNLIDYSGAHGLTTTPVQSDGRVLIKTAPVGHTIAGAYGHGYSIWAPLPNGVSFANVTEMYNYLATYNQLRGTQTTQEWEMADDLGDSHCLSLHQGGRLPDNKTNERIVGKIFPDSAKLISISVSPEVDGRDLTLSLYNANGTLLYSTSGISTAASPLIGNYTATLPGWVIIKVRNTFNNYSGQKCWVKASYTAPAVVNTALPANILPDNICIWTGNKNTSDVLDCGNWEDGKVPTSTSHVIVYGHASPFPVVAANLTVNKVSTFQGATLTVNPGVTLTILSQ